MSKIQIDSVELEIPVPPRKCTGTVTLIPAPTVSDRRASLVVTGKFDRLLMNLPIKGLVKETVRFQPSLKQGTVEKRSVTMHAADNRVRVSGPRRDFDKLERFYKAILPFFDQQTSPLTNYQLFQATTESSTALSKDSHRAPSDPNPVASNTSASSSLNILAHPVASAASEATTPVSPASSSRKRTATSSPTNDGRSPRKQAKSFYGKDAENKHYASFGVGSALRNRGAGTEGSGIHGGLFDAPVDDTASIGDAEIRRDSKSSTSLPETPKKRKSVPALFAPDRRSTPFAATTNQQGLTNLGNTCYMNAVVQLLFTLKSFVIDFLQVGKSLAVQTNVASQSSRTPFHSLKNGAPPNSSSPITSPSPSVFRSFFNLASIWESKTGNQSCGKLEALARFKRALSSKAKQFKGHGQQDAHEFLVFLLDILKDEIEEKIGNANDVENTLGITPAVNPVVDNFQFVIENRYACQSCKAASSNSETLLCLQGSFPSSSSEATVQGVVDAFFRSEVVEKRCDRCGGNRAKRTVALKSAPRILIVALVRFTCEASTNRVGKDSRPVSVSSFLTLSQYIGTEGKPASEFRIPKPLPAKDSPVSRVLASLAPLTSARKPLDVKYTSPRAGSKSPLKQPASSSSYTGVRSEASHPVRRLSSSFITPTKSSSEVSARNSRVDDEVVIQVSDSDDDEDFRRVLQLSRLEAEGRAAEAERIRHNILSSNTPKRGSSSFNATSTPASKVDQLRTESRSCVSFPNLEGFGQMPPSRQTSSGARKDLKDMTEEEQIEMALQLSMTEQQQKGFNLSHGENAEVLNDAPPFPHPASHFRFFDDDDDEVDGFDRKENVCPSPDITDTEATVRGLSVGQRPESPAARDDAEAQLTSSEATFLNGTSSEATFLNGSQERDVERGNADDPLSQKEPEEEPHHHPTLLRQNEESGFLPNSFRLLAVVSHLGSDPVCGHYVTDAFDFRSRTWKRLDDDRVSETSIDAVKSKRARQAYLFAYMGKDVFGTLKKHYAEMKN